MKFKFICTKHNVELEPTEESGPLLSKEPVPTEVITFDLPHFVDAGSSALTKLTPMWDIDLSNMRCPREGPYKGLECTADWEIHAFGDEGAWVAYGV